MDCNRSQHEILVDDHHLHAYVMFDYSLNYYFHHQFDAFDYFQMDVSLLRTIRFFFFFVAMNKKIFSPESSSSTSSGRGPRSISKAFFSISAASSAVS